MWYTHTHTHTGILLRHKKKNEIMPFAATWIDLEIIIFIKSSQTNMFIIFKVIFNQKAYCKTLVYK